MHSRQVSGAHASGETDRAIVLQEAAARTGSPAGGDWQGAEPQGGHFRGHLEPSSAAGFASRASQQESVTRERPEQGIAEALSQCLFSNGFHDPGL